MLSLNEYSDHFSHYSDHSHRSPAVKPDTPKSDRSRKNESDPNSRFFRGYEQEKIETRPDSARQAKLEPSPAITFEELEVVNKLDEPFVTNAMPKARNSDGSESARSRYSNSSFASEPKKRNLSAENRLEHYSSDFSSDNAWKSEKEAEKREGSDTSRSRYSAYSNHSEKSEKSEKNLKSEPKSIEVKKSPNSGRVRYSSDYTPDSWKGGAVEKPGSDTARSAHSVSSNHSTKSALKPPEPSKGNSSARYAKEYTYDISPQKVEPPQSAVNGSESARSKVSDKSHNEVKTEDLQEEVGNLLRSHSMSEIHKIGEDDEMLFDRISQNTSMEDSRESSRANSHRSNAKTETEMIFDKTDTEFIDGTEMIFDKTDTDMPSELTFNKTESEFPSDIIFDKTDTERTELDTDLSFMSDRHKLNSARGAATSGSPRFAAGTSDSEFSSTVLRFPKELSESPKSTEKDDLSPHSKSSLKTASLKTGTSRKDEPSKKGSTKGSLRESKLGKISEKSVQYDSDKDKTENDFSFASFGAESEEELESLHVDDGTFVLRFVLNSTNHTCRFQE